MKKRGRRKDCSSKAARPTLWAAVRQSALLWAVILFGAVLFLYLGVYMVLVWTGTIKIQTNIARDHRTVDRVLIFPATESLLKLPKRAWMYEWLGRLHYRWQGTIPRGWLKWVELQNSRTSRTEEEIVLLRNLEENPSFHFQTRRGWSRNFVPSHGKFSFPAQINSSVIIFAQADRQKANEIVTHYFYGHWRDGKTTELSETVTVETLEFPVGSLMYTPNAGGLYDETYSLWSEETGTYYLYSQISLR